MAETTTYLTSDGVKKLKDELETLKNEKRDEIAKRLKLAIEQGDISENADYDSAKEDQAFVEGRIKQIENMLANVTLIDDLEREKGVVAIGSTVTLQEVGFDEKEVYTIVGTAEADPKNNKISFESPIGKAIFNHKKGQTVTIVPPEGDPFKMKIVKVE